jgi:DNA-binding response OmpR family regulator
VQRILVVEDEPALCNLIADILRDEGFDVEEAISFQSAVSHLETTRYDCVLSDIRMPDGTGIDLARQVLAGNEAKMALMTGYAKEPIPDWVQRLGVPVLNKPFVWETLVAELRKLLRS